MRISYQNRKENPAGLTLAEIREACPSVFATTHASTVSEKYATIETAQVLIGLMDNGFVPTLAMQAKAKVEGREGFTKHLLRFRQAGIALDYDAEYPEIVLTNAHDGSASYNLLMGYFRMICSNGMVTGNFENVIRVRHTGDVVGKVVDSTIRIIEEKEQLEGTIEEMKQVQLSREEQLLLAEYAIDIRYDISEKDKEMAQQMGMDLVPYKPSDFLRTRRLEDRSNDLYTTFNVVQENMIKGGVSRRDAEGKHTVRPVKDIDKNVKMNQMLWQLTQRMLELKK